MTWYHLVSHIFGPPKQKDVIANQSADWCGNLLPQDTACASTRFNGRTRGCLPIDIPAPRPCSAVPDLPHHTNRGSLKGFACVLFSSSLFPNIPAHYTDKRPHLSTFKLHFIVPPPRRVRPPGRTAENWNNFRISRREIILIAYGNVILFYKITGASGMPHPTKMLLSEQ